MNGIGTLYERRARGFRVAHATVAKVNKKEAIRSDLSGLGVILVVGTKKRPEGDCPSGLKTNRRFANGS